MSATAAHIPTVPALSPVDYVVLFVLPLSLMLLLALAGSPTLRGRLGPGMALALGALAFPPAFTYVLVIASGHGF